MTPRYLIVDASTVGPLRPAFSVDDRAIAIVTCRKPATRDLERRKHPPTSDGGINPHARTLCAEATHDLRSHRPTAKVVTGHAGRDDELERIGSDLCFDERISKCGNAHAA